MADKTIGELPSLTTMEDDTLIPVEHDGTAKSMAGTVLESYVYGLVEDDVETISEIIAVGPQGVSPTLSSSKSGKVTTIYYTDATHTSGTDVLATINDGQDGNGAGDMTKAVYDTDNDGVVDNAEQLGGYGPSHYATLDSSGKIIATQATAKQEWITTNTTLTTSHNGCRLIVDGTKTITIPSTLPEGFECEIVNFGSGTVTIAGSGVYINGNTNSLTSSKTYDVEVLAALMELDWIAKGDFR